jgi:hypothetical protein
MIRYGQIIPRIDPFVAERKLLMEDVGIYISNSIADPRLGADLKLRIQNYTKVTGATQDKSPVKILLDSP